MKTTVDELLSLGDAGATIINAGEHAGGREIARKLASDGFSEVRVLDATLHDWEARGLPVQEPTIEQAVPAMRPSDVNELDRRP